MMPLLLLSASSMKPLLACHRSPSHILYRWLPNTRRVTIGSGSGIQLPAPTWSLKDLHLTTATDESTTSDRAMTTQTVSRDQLRILAKRAVLDLDQLQEDDQVEVLRRDVEHMLHMMHVVETIPLPDLSDEEIYDLPRGVTHTPLRSSGSHPPTQDTATSAAAFTGNASDDDDDDGNKRNRNLLLEREEQDAQEVWKSLLQPKTVKLGGHSYFRIVTKHPLSSPSNEKK